MFSLAVQKGCGLIDDGESVAAVMQALGIDQGTSAERLLYAHSGQKPPAPVYSSSSGSTHDCRAGAAASAQSDARHSPPPTADVPRRVQAAAPNLMPDLLPFPVYVVPREPHRYRSPEGEAWLTEMCRKVAHGADYQQVFDDSGYQVPTSEFGGECSELKALHDQAMGSARNALLAGKSHPEAVAWFHIKKKSDLLSLAMYAAEEVGAPRVRDGEDFNAVKMALGISAYGKAVQVLVEAMRDD